MFFFINPIINDPDLMTYRKFHQIILSLRVIPRGALNFLGYFVSVYSLKTRHIAGNKSMAMEDYSDIYTLSAIFIVLLLLIAVSVFVLFIFSGLFASVVVETGKPPIGEVYLAYKDGTGPYSGVGSTFFESTSIAPDLRQMGIYYDEPGTVSTQ